MAELGKLRKRLNDVLDRKTGPSQREIAKKVGVTQVTISAWANGAISGMRLQSAERLDKVLTEYERQQRRKAKVGTK